MAKLQELSTNKIIKDAVNPDLRLAFDVISKKREPYDLLYKYYKGDHPLRYSTERLKKAFDKIGTYFAQNWLAVIVDAVLDRINLKGFDITDEEANTIIEDLWEKYSISLLTDDVHEAATVLGEGYVIAWREDNENTVDLDGNEVEGEEITDVYYNDPRMCHVFYDSYRPTQKRFAAKIWIDADGYPCMLLYYPDRLEHYKSRSKIKGFDTWIFSSGTFQLDNEYGNGGIEPNEYGVIPVFHFRSGRISGKREIGQSEISLQDAINKLFADMMVGSEFYTFTQRVIISQSDPGDLKNGAGVNWWIPSGDGKGQGSNVIELGAKSLENYIQALDHVAQSMAVISRTPNHYFALTGGNISGDALLAMEAPLNKKVKKRIEGYEVEWKALIKFLLLLEGKEIESNKITPVWEPVYTSQPLATAQTTKTEVESGVPLKTSVRRAGWAQDEIDQMDKDIKEDQKRTSSLAQEELDRLRAEKDMENEDGSNSKGDVNA